MKRHSVTLTMVGPLMATGLEPVAPGVDAPFRRDHQGRIVIPGTQIRGILRHTMEAMARAAPGKLPQSRVAELFGTASAGPAGDGDGEAFESKTAKWEPNFRRIDFSDFIADGRDGDSNTITRIEVDGFTGSVSHGSLQILEQPVGIGEEVAFKGRLDIEDGEEGMVEWVTKALRLVPAIGAHKSAGFGRVLGVELGEGVGLETSAAVDEATAAEIVRTGAAEIVLDFDGPFLVSAERWNSNLISGAENIPGSVLKAVLARETGADEVNHPLHGALAGCVVTELRPAKKNEARPQTPPVSLYYIDLGGDGEGNEIEDAIVDPPDGWAADGVVISFSTDWKNRERTLAAKKFPRSFQASRKVCTRTAIDDTGCADSGKLFTYAAIDPAGYVWKGRLLKGTLDDNTFLALLQGLPNKLFAIGKTRISAGLSAKQTPPPASAAVSGETIIVLETDACLHTPDDLFAFEDAPSEAERLRLQYQAYFANALRDRAGGAPPSFEDAALSLRFYATQKRMGGYMAARYPPIKEGYYPWLLTRAGSVFRFTIPEGCEEAMRSFAARGLPVPRGFDDRRSGWRGNPFVPENGFGEVRINAVA